MILKKRDRILEVFDYLDCDKFEGKDHVGINIIDKNISKYKTLWKVIAFISNIAFVLQCFVPIILYLIGRKNVELPVSQYYFLSEDLRSDYYLVLALYQNLGIYGHMTYNVNIDTFIAGMIIMTIAQLKVLKHKFSTMELDQAKINSSENISKLNQILRHYESIIEYSNIVQDIISLTMFVQFCMGTCIICVVALLMVSSTESFIIMASYSFVMVMQIFLPAYLGTQLTYESQELAHAAYSTDWIPQSEPYKRSLRLFVERANTPIVFTGLKMFPLALSTFVSIIKMTYSIFALVRKVQDREM
ncbi:hypothetical protein evm_000911 [Chilo suppressalis]|nr:hypothetical protein evm_000911 [Chilo suppressalis]